MRVSARGCRWPHARASASARGGSFVRITPSGVRAEPSPFAAWPRPLPAAGSGEPGVRPLGPCLAREASARVPAPAHVGRPGREDQTRAALTGNNPGRCALGWVNDRARPRRPAHCWGRPITLSPSNAPSRAAIGPARTPPAPDWPQRQNEPRPRSAVRGPDAGLCVRPSVRGVRLDADMWPYYDPQSGPNTPGPI